MSNLQYDQEGLADFQTWTYPDEQFLESTCGQQSGDIIEQVRENATLEYKLTKQKKQQELSCRVDDAKGISKTAFKNAKKKVDNHASSVASRSRRVYLIDSYETLVKNKMQENSRLAKLLIHQRAIEAKKDVDIRRMQFKIHTLTKELDNLKLKLSTTQSTVPSSCNSLTQDNRWSQELSIDSIPYATTTTPTAPSARYIQRNAVPFNHPLDRTQLQDESFEDAGQQANDLTTYLAGDPAPSPAEDLQGVEDCFKMESGDWGAVPVINFKDAQAQMKADTPDNVLHPAV